MNDGFFQNGSGNSDAFDNYMDMMLSNGLEADGEADASGADAHSGAASGNCRKHSRKMSPGGKPLYDSSKDSSGVTIIKCLLVIGLCLGGIILPAAAEMEGLALAAFPLAGVGLSVLVLKNT